MTPLQTLLRAVARRLRRERLAAIARHAAWGCVLIALLAVLLHLFVRPVSPPGLALCLALTAVLAASQIIVTRATPADCAAWADRHLGGRSAYATSLEVLARPQDLLAPAATHLESWVAQAVPSSVAQLAERPFDAGLRKPLAAAAVCVALALALLQLPTRARTPQAATTPTTMHATTAPDRHDVRARRQRPDAALESDAPEPAARQTAARGAAQQPVVRAGATDAATQAGQAQDGSVAPAAGTAATPAATGREAGDVADTGGANVLSAPPQVELAARLREIAMQAPRGEPRADASRDADFVGGSAAGFPGDAALAAAPATPPPAAAATPMAPAERAYLRAYWSDRRTNP